MTEYKKSVLKNPGNMPNNFIHDFIDQDLAKGGQYEGRTVHTRFPPESDWYRPSADYISPDIFRL